MISFKEFCELPAKKVVAPTKISARNFEPKNFMINFHDDNKSLKPTRPTRFGMVSREIMAVPNWRKTCVKCGHRSKLLDRISKNKKNPLASLRIDTDSF